MKFTQVDLSKMRTILGEVPECDFSTVRARWDFYHSRTDELLKTDPQAWQEWRKVTDPYFDSHIDTALKSILCA